MKRQRRTVCFSWILLSVFVPMLLLSSLHIHTMAEPVGLDCYECEHHLQHAGHLSTATPTIDNCLLCQFLTVHGLPAAVFILPYFHTVGTHLPSALACLSPQGFWGTCLSRGPPVASC